MQVGFASLALEVSNVETGKCEAKVTREGLFGEIRVQWRAGYPSGQGPSGFRHGTIMPNSGEIPCRQINSEKLNDSSTDSGISLHLHYLCQLFFLMCSFLIYRLTNPSPWREG